jgi:hypothetical protein
LLLLAAENLTHKRVCASPLDGLSGKKKVAAKKRRDNIFVT